MTNRPCQILEAMRHTVTMRIVERGRTVPEREVESIALDMLVELERRLRAADTKGKESRNGNPRT